VAAEELRSINSPRAKISRVNFYFMKRVEVNNDGKRGKIGLVLVQCRRFGISFHFNWW